MGEKEEWEVTVDEYGISFWGDENVLELRVMIDEQLLTILKTIEMCTLRR